MSQEYNLPPVDVYNLPPKELLGTIPSVGEWFEGYNSTNVMASTGYYADRLFRAPFSSTATTPELKAQYDQGHSAGAGH